MIKLNDNFANLLQIFHESTNIIDTIYLALILDIMYVNFFERLGFDKKFITKKVHKLKQQGLEINFDPINMKYVLVKNNYVNVPFVVVEKVNDKQYIVKFYGKYLGQLHLNSPVDLKKGSSLSLPIMLEFKDGEFIGYASI